MILKLHSIFLLHLKTATTEMESRLHLFKNYKYVTIITISLYWSVEWHHMIWALAHKFLQPAKKIKHIIY